MSVHLTLFCCKKSMCFCNHSKYYCRLESEEWVTLPHWGRLYLCFWQLSRGEFHQVVDFSADLCHSGFRFCIPKWGLGIISLFVYHLGIKITFCLVKQLAKGLFFFFFFWETALDLSWGESGGNGKDLDGVLRQGTARHQFQKLCEENKIGHCIGPPSLFRNYLFLNCSFIKTTHNVKFAILTVFKIIQLNSVTWIHMVVQLVFKTFSVSQTETYPVNLAPFPLLL